MGRLCALAGTLVVAAGCASAGTGAGTPPARASLLGAYDLRAPGVVKLNGRMSIEADTVVLTFLHTTCQPDKTWNSPETMRLLCDPIDDMKDLTVLIGRADPVTRTAWSATREVDRRSTGGCTEYTTTPTGARVCVVTGVTTTRVEAPVGGRFMATRAGGQPRN